MGGEGKREWRTFLEGEGDSGGGIRSGVEEDLSASHRQDRFHTDSSVATGIVTANAGSPSSPALVTESPICRRPKPGVNLDLGTP